MYVYVRSLVKRNMRDLYNNNPAGSEKDLSTNKSSTKQAVDRSQAVVKWAGGEAAATGVTAAMAAVGITTVIAPAVAVRYHDRHTHMRGVYVV